jgi:hypothetical protein
VSDLDSFVQKNFSAAPSLKSGELPSAIIMVRFPDFPFGSESEGLFSDFQPISRMARQKMLYDIGQRRSHRYGSSDFRHSSDNCASAGWGAGVAALWQCAGGSG